MPIRTTVVGSYPKVTDQGTDNLPGVIDRWQRKLLDDQALEQELQRVIRRVVKEQEQAGLTLITDGQIRWEDLAHPIVRSTEGIRRGSLRRFFNNNVYYRRLELDGTAHPGSLSEAGGPIRWVKSSVAEEFRFVQGLTKTPVKVVLPGPLTLVVFTELKTNQTREWLLGLYADLLRKEVEALTSAGAREIQLDEPAFSAEELLLPQAVEAINRIFQDLPGSGAPGPPGQSAGWTARSADPSGQVTGPLVKGSDPLGQVTGPLVKGSDPSGKGPGQAGLRRWVAMYFQDVSPILPLLAKLKVEGLSLDLVSLQEKEPQLLSKVAAWLKSESWPGEVALGLIDARNTKLEKPDELKCQVESFAKAIPLNRLWLSPSCGLEFLPHSSALRKLQLLRETSQAL